MLTIRSQAPCEAEAQCAALVKTGKVFATATEDMDALTFGCNVLLRRLTFSEARKLPVQEIHLDKVLEGLELNRDEVRVFFFLPFFSVVRGMSFFVNCSEIALFKPNLQRVLYI